MACPSVCRVCLSDDVNLHHVSNPLLANYYKKLSGVQLKQLKRKYPETLCQMCLKELGKFGRFVEVAKRSNKALELWIHDQTELKSSAKLLYKYTTSTTEYISITSQDNLIKEENDDNNSVAQNCEHNDIHRSDSESKCISVVKIENENRIYNQIESPSFKRKLLSIDEIESDKDDDKSDITDTVSNETDNVKIETSDTVKIKSEDGTDDPDKRSTRRVFFSYESDSDLESNHDDCNYAKSAELSRDDNQAAELSKDDIQAAGLSKDDIQAVELSKDDIQAVELSKDDIQAAELSKDDIQAAELSKDDIQAAELSNDNPAEESDVKFDNTIVSDDGNDRSVSNNVIFDDVNKESDDESDDVVADDDDNVTNDEERGNNNIEAVNKSIGNRQLIVKLIKYPMEQYILKKKGTATYTGIDVKEPLPGQLTTTQDSPDSSNVPTTKQRPLARRTARKKRANLTNTKYTIRKVVPFQQSSKNGKDVLFCNFCDYKCSANTRSICHTRTRTVDKPFSCTECNYKTVTQILLNKHMRKHSVEPHFACTKCNYQTKTKCELDVHIKKHTDTKIFVCHICSYKSSLKEMLRKHLMTHTDSKIFKCDFCHAKFRTNFKLKEHHLVHTCEARFSCDICDYKCATKSSFISHMIQTHW